MFLQIVIRGLYFFLQTFVRYMGDDLGCFGAFEA